jgi:hypothetical protein
MNSLADETETPLKVDFCDVAENPQLYDGKVIEINARQIRLKKNEWGLRGNICLPPFFLVFPEDISPKPPFILERTDAINELIASRNERAAFRADFVGRFDWAGTDKKNRFGRSKESMRFVLQSISNPIKIILPYK